MKNLKRLLAFLGILVMAGMYVLSLILAITDHSKAGNMLMASLYATVIIPIMLYAFLLVHKWTHPKDEVISPIIPEEEKVDTLIFALDRVLIRYNWKKVYSSLKFDEKTCRAVSEATYLSPAWTAGEEGNKTDEELLQSFIENNPTCDEDIRQFFQHMGKAVSVCPYTRDWLTYLKKRGYRIYVLSNMSKPVFDECQKELKFLEMVDGVYFSWQAHCLKPEPVIFQSFLETFSVDPSRAVLVDHVLENVAEARSQGLNAIHFTGRKHAIKQLQEFGVK